MKNQEKPQSQSNNLLFAVILILIALVGVVCVLFIFKSRNTTKTSETVENTYTETEKWQEGDVTYKGKTYRYNSGAKAYLFLGIDSDEKAQAGVDNNHGGQADAQFLFVIDTVNKKNSIIAINRNSMVDFTMCDKYGYEIGTVNAQICLAHAYGDGLRTSCINACNAVQGMMKNIPMSGYMSVRRGAIPAINDSIGGVTLTPEYDFDSGEYTFKAGQTVTLKGDQAKAYLSRRDVNVFNSATDRLDRQKQYINAFIDQATEYVDGDVDRAVDIYDSVEPYIVTDIDFADFIGKVMEYGFDMDAMYTIPGNVTTDDEGYEQFNIDEDGLYEIILDVFYTEV